MDRFHITYWWGPPPVETTEKRYQEVKDAGFTLNCPPGPVGDDWLKNTPQQVNQMILDYSHKLGMKAVIQDPRVTKAVANEPGWREALKELVSEVGNHPGLAGYHIVDEPSASAFPQLGEIVAEFRRLDPKHYSYINVFPNFASVSQFGTPTYKQYLDDYIRIVKPAFVSYDHYHWMIDAKAPAAPPLTNERERAIWDDAWSRRGSGLDRPGYLTNLQEAYDACAKSRLPIWVIAILLPCGPYRDPGPGELRWDAYQALAYGTKCMSWFTYWCPVAGGGWDWKYACFTTDGKRTHNYAEIAEVNKEIQPIGQALFKRRCLSAMHVGGESEQVLQFKPTAQIKDVQGGRFTLGVFDGGVVLVANKDYQKKATSRIKLNGVTTASQFARSTGRYRRIPIKDGWISIDLQPGGGELIKLT